MFLIQDLPSNAQILSTSENFNKFTKLVEIIPSRRAGGKTSNFLIWEKKGNYFLFPPVFQFGNAVIYPSQPATDPNDFIRGPRLKVSLKKDLTNKYKGFFPVTPRVFGSLEKSSNSIISFLEFEKLKVIIPSLRLEQFYSYDDSLASFLRDEGEFELNFRVENPSQYNSWGSLSISDPPQTDQVFVKELKKKLNENDLELRLIFYSGEEFNEITWIYLTKETLFKELKPNLHGAGGEKFFLQANLRNGIKMAARNYIPPSSVSRSQIVKFFDNQEIIGNWFKRTPIDEIRVETKKEKRILDLIKAQSRESEEYKEMFTEKKTVLKDEIPLGMLLQERYEDFLEVNLKIGSEGLPSDFEWQMDSMPYSRLVLKEMENCGESGKQTFVSKKGDLIEFFSESSDASEIEFLKKGLRIIDIGIDSRLMVGQNIEVTEMAEDKRIFGRHFLIGESLGIFLDEQSCSHNGKRHEVGLKVFK